MPKPRKSELDRDAKTEFVSRCMSSAESKRDFPRQDQRAAFCNSVWRQSKRNRSDR